MASVNTK